MTGTANGLADRLKAETQALHQEAESQPFQRALVQGALTREGYVAFLGQMLNVHRTLEARLRSILAPKRDGRSSAAPGRGQSSISDAGGHRSEPRRHVLASIIHHGQFKENLLRADLEFLGADADAVKPLGATREVITAIDDAAARDDTALLGFHYVLEGSTNGSKFVARSVSQAYGLKPGPGLSYLDPYGDKQRENWQAFRAAMDTLELTGRQQDAIVVAAKRMFAGSIAMSRELAGRFDLNDTPAQAASPAHLAE